MCTEKSTRVITYGLTLIPVDRNPPGDLNGLIKVIIGICCLRAGNLLLKISNTALESKVLILKCRILLLKR